MPSILDTHSLRSAFRVAKKLSSESKYLEASQIYSEIVSKYPRNSEARAHLKRLSNDRVETSNSVEINNPPEEVIHRLLTNYQRSEFTLISKELNILENQYPKSNFLWKLKGGLALQRDDLEDAKKCFNKALLFKQVDSSAYMNLGIIARREGNLREATAFLERAIDINPPHF